jgi:hypothetical protein
MMLPNSSVPLATVVDDDVLEALLTEARQLDRDPGDLLTEKLRCILPAVLAEAAHELLIPENDGTPGTHSGGSGSTLPRIESTADTPSIRLFNRAPIDGTQS